MQESFGHHTATAACGSGGINWCDCLREDWRESWLWCRLNNAQAKQYSQSPDCPPVVSETPSPRITFAS